MSHETDPSLQPEKNLIDCDCCGSNLVYPLDFWQVEDDSAGQPIKNLPDHDWRPHRWEVTTRCPNCEDVQTGVYDQETVDRFDSDLDLGEYELRQTLRQIIRLNMQDEINRFVGALAADQILPEDF